MIYHIVPEKEYLKLINEKTYLPGYFRENGFVHCSLEVSVIPVADDYYSETEETLLLLRIDPNKLEAEVKYEEADPDPEGGQSHLSTSTVFPHIYGPVDNAAVDGVGVLIKNKTGYAWPIRFLPLKEYLEGCPENRSTPE